MTAPIVEILPDKAALVQHALQRVLNVIHRAIAEHGFCTLALAGGSTPQPLYQGLAEKKLPWEKLYIFWGDERYVPVHHPSSNAGMAKQAWLDRVPIPAAQIFITPTDEGDPHQSAQQYEKTLRSVFGPLQGLSPDEVPQFDLILLGMGDDGHTASLFPYTDTLAVRDRLVTVGSKDREPRITFTVSLINRSRSVMFLAAGANKQTALQQVFSPDGDDQAYPSRLVHPIGELYWLLDAEAVGNLELPTAARL
ncbi:MAG: 6-phosphogluconolactonase [Leptolyngbyaceae cyanobacterium SM2_5_2]|nr:6-phosphogluconolactonase [Leptolyngbyaceae cyanobacterium SM2_5_2]